MEGCYFATLPCIRCVLRGIWLGYIVRSPPTNSILPQRLGYLQPTRGNLRWVFTCNATSLLTLISWEIPTYVAHPKPAVSNKIRSSWIVQVLGKFTSPDTAKSSSVPDRDFNPSTKEKTNFSPNSRKKFLVRKRKRLRRVEPGGHSGLTGPKCNYPPGRIRVSLETHNRPRGPAGRIRVSYETHNRPAGTAFGHPGAGAG